MDDAGPLVEADNDEGLMAADGRRLGTRALQTRQRLLDATAELLAEVSIRDLKVVDVVRRVGVSPASFYQYFADVEEAVVALAEEVSESLSDFAPHFAHPWEGAEGLGQARRFIDDYMDYWDRHRAILRVRNLGYEEGDERFRKVYVDASIRLVNLLTSQIERGQAVGRVAEALHPYATAGAMLAMVERTVAFNVEYERRGVGRDALAETLARILFTTVTGVPADSVS